MCTCSKMHAITVRTVCTRSRETDGRNVGSTDRRELVLFVKDIRVQATLTFEINHAY